RFAPAYRAWGRFDAAYFLGPCAALSLPATFFLRMESPGGGGASGCREYTGNRIDTGIGVPRSFAGTNLSSRDPLIAAESSGAMLDDSITRVESSTTVPSLSTYNRNVTLPCTFSAYNAGGYRNGISLFSMIG